MLIVIEKIIFIYLSRGKWIVFQTSILLSLSRAKWITVCFKRSSGSRFSGSLGSQPWTFEIVDLGCRDRRPRFSNLRTFDLAYRDLSIYPSVNLWFILMVSTNSDYWWFFFETCPPYTPHELELLDCGVRRRVLSDFWILLKKFIFPELFVWKIFLMEKVRGKWFFWTVFFVCHFYNVNCYWKNHFHIFVAGKMNCFPNINFAKFVAGKMNYSLF